MKTTTDGNSEHTGIAEREFRIFLQNEFVSRCRLNPQFSLRAFAKFLNVDQSLLSKVLRGHRPPSKALIEKICYRIGLSPSEILAFTSGGEDSKSGYDVLSEDSFAILSDWYHFALLELLKTKGCKSDSAWLAERLGISAIEVNTALERLERMGFLEKRRNRWSHLIPNNTWTNTEATSAARRNLQRNLLEMSLKAIDQVEFSKRENGSLTIACDEKLLPEIKERLTAFRRDLDKFIESQGNFTQVYQLVISFFPLSSDPRSGT